MRIPNPIALGLSLALASFACRSAEEPASGSPDSVPGPVSGSAPPVEPTPQPPPPDPERAAKLGDLDAMCEALDHDYSDGTLGDYYAKVEPRTDWGNRQLEAGEASIQPGRLLEKAVAELDPGANDPALEHCKKLLDYLDDVE